jgi:hypothetical protein
MGIVMSCHVMSYHLAVRLLHLCSPLRLLPLAVLYWPFFMRCADLVYVATGTHFMRVLRNAKNTTATTDCRLILATGTAVRHEFVTAPTTACRMIVALRYATNM